MELSRVNETTIKMYSSISSSNEEDLKEASTLLSDLEAKEVEIVDNRLLKTKKHLLVCISMAILFFFGFCNFSVIAPFFPTEGAKKGATTSITGLIFAVYPLGTFIMAPIIGKYLPVLGANYCLIAGTFLEGASVIIFGFVEDLPDGPIFITFCFIIRIVTSIGTACSQTAGFAIMSIMFKENLSTVFGILELFTGLGLMTGPAIGGVLFKVGGFKIPFITIGSVLVLAAFIVYWILPDESEYSKEENHSDKDGGNKDEEVGSISSILRIPGVFMISITIVVTGMVLSFLDPTLTNHLEDITNNTITSEKVGLFFLAMPLVYTILAPFFGYLTDKKIDGRKAIIFGHLFVFLGYFFLGPSPLVKSYIKSSLWLTALSLCVSGIGVAPLFVPGLADMTKSVQYAGLPDTIGTNGILSGIYSGCFSIGAVIGPTVGGFLTDHMSFDWASTIFAFLVLFEGLVLIIFTVWERNSKWVKKKGNLKDKLVAEDSETKPLLENCG